MSMVYHSYDSNNAAVNELVAGAYAEHVGTLGGDESLSTVSRNWVENKVITQRILQDETNYLLKSEAETKYAVEYVNAVPATVRDKIYSVGGDFYAGDSANSTLHELGKVKTVNGQSPDSNGNVTVDTGVKTVNGQSPDSNGNVTVDTGVKTVNGQTGNVTVDTGVMTVNSIAPTSGNVYIDVGVKTVNNTAPDANGNVNVQAGVTSVNGQTGAVTIYTGSAITASVSGSTLTLTW
jgi:hypothetical protein